MTTATDDLLYLDHAAGAPLRPEAAEAMAAAYRDLPGNPSSLGRPGREAQRHLRRAREALAALVGIQPDQVIFTSGGTESIGLGFLGALAGRTGGRVVVSAIEHPAVLETARLAGRRGFSVVKVVPAASGVVLAARVAAAVTADTVLCAVMAVNNEIGTEQPVAEALAAARASAPRCVTFCDAVQALGRVPVRPVDWGADLVALSAHKVGGPRGVGALLCPGARPEALYGGGGQELGVRPGTENLPGILGFVAAARLAEAEREAWRARATALRAGFLAALAAAAPRARVNGAAAVTVPDVISVSVPGLTSEALLRGLEELGVIVSAGAACLATKQRQSHVLAALGVPGDHATARISFGRETTAAQLDRAALALATTWSRYAIS